jgi:poly(A) polymerase
MLECHPHPRDFSDKSRPFYCCYFMGLQRKQGVPVNEGEQFDMRGTVYEFKLAVHAYSTKKPGMDISVSHVRRRDIPSFVFPGDVRPSRSSKSTWDSRRAAEQKISEDKSPESKGVSDGLDDVRKRKRVESIADADSRNVKLSTRGNDDCAVVNMLVMEKAASDVADVKNLETFGEGSSRNGLLGCDDLSSGVLAAVNVEKEEEKLAIEKIVSGPYNTSEIPSQELEELEDIEFGTQNPNGSLMEPLTDHGPATVPVPSGSGPGPSTGFHLNGCSEDLEPVELAVPMLNAIPAAPVAQRKPLIKLSFTTISNTGGKSG